MSKITIKEAKRQLREQRVSLKKNSFGEFEVRLNEDPTSATYHTDDLQDAIDTGLYLRDRVYRLQFEKVMTAAEAACDRELVIDMMCAQDNGADTAQEHGYNGDPDRYPYYWQICLGTLASNISDRSYPEGRREWFKAQGVI
jgi:hypothetical protein